MIGNPLLLGGGDYEISRSVRLRSSASAFFNRTPSSAGNRQIWTLSGWVKQGSDLNSIFSTNSSDNLTYNYFGFSANAFRLYQWNGSAYDFHLITTAVYRDPSAWYHFVIRVDTTQATAANRVRLYINSVEVTAFSTNTTPSQNLNTYVNSTSYSHLLGRNPAGSSTYFDGYLTEINFIDGQALTPSSFGESNATTGVWQPKKYTGTYGTNGFYLNFSDNSNNTAATIGKDYSGNGNNWTPNNISVTSGATYDSMLDVPTPWADGGNGRGNYAVLNPLGNVASGTLSNANLQHTRSFAYIQASIPISTGQWYWEVTLNALGSAGLELGILGQLLNGSNTIGGSTVGYGYDPKLGRRWAATVNTSGQTTSTVNDVIGFAFDASALTLQIFKNNTSLFTITGITAGEYFPTCNGAGTAGTDTVTFNFGQRPFAYTPPSGFKALNTLNLPEPTIKKGNLYFDATLWTGNGTSQTITNSGAMQPDFVWAKKRNSTSFSSHQLVDAVRGTSAYLFTDATSAEVTATDRVTAFNANGFSVSSASQVNGNADTFVGWQWKEGATQGFDIVTYTGNGANRTIAHSLGVKPALMIIKKRNASATDWIVYSAVRGADRYLALNLTSAETLLSTVFNNTDPTSSVFSLGTASGVNANNDTYVNYLFAEVAGFSRFGSYTGNGSTDGPFVFTGFRPRWIMIKNIQDSTTAWSIWDTSRSPSNIGDQRLEANASAAESSLAQFDLLSNGFKLRSSNSNNASGQTIIFAAFAEHPFKLSLAR